MEIGLVLGGGGARGFAHIGVLRALDEHGIRPVAIAGCSMGGIVGALYAAGHTPLEIEHMFEDISGFDLMSWGKGGSLIGGEGIVKQLAKHLPTTFAELKIPLNVVAVDVQEGKQVILNTGELLIALRATSAIPGVISAVVYEDRILIDGGLINNLPVDVIRTMTQAPVVAVEVGAPRDRRLQFDRKRRLRDIFTGHDSIRRRPLILELFNKAFDIPAAMLTDLRLALNPPELLVRPQLDPDLKTEDFHRLEEAVTAGYAAAVTEIERSSEALTSES